jgi:iron complex transport system substrate-binding protein
LPKPKLTTEGLTRRDAVLSGAALGSTVLAPAIARGQTRTIIDAMALHIEIKHPVERVVFASHFAHEDFTAIAGPEGWSKVVGFCREPWEDWRAGTYTEYARVIPHLAAVADIGTLHTSFDEQKVIALKPDVFLWDIGTDGISGDQLSALRAANIPIVRFDFQDKSTFSRQRSIVAVTRCMGAERRASGLLTLIEFLHDDIMKRVPWIEPFTQSVYAEVAETGPDIVGFTDAGRLWGGMAVNLGALNIADGKVPDYGGPLAHADLVAADPDLIFFVGGLHPPHSRGVRTGYGVDAATTRAGLAAYAARPGYDRLKAVRAGAVHAVDRTLVWSLRDVYGLQYMAKQLYPAEFEDIDPVKGLADFHARFLPVPFSGTWFQRLGA